MKILRDFLESRDLSQCIPCQEILLDKDKKIEDVMDEHIQACVEKDGCSNRSQESVYVVTW